MTTQTREAIRIKIVGSHGGRRFELIDGISGEVQWQTPISDGEVDETNHMLSDELLDIYRDLDSTGLNQSKQAAAAALDRLSGLARRVSFTLFQGSNLIKLRDLAMRRAPAALNPGESARVVGVTLPKDFAFPFELLPWHSAAESMHPVLRIRALLGMSAVVQRQPPADGEDPADKARDLTSMLIGDLQDHKPLPMTVFRHPKLKAAEVDYLQTVPRDFIHVYGPWPGNYHITVDAAMHHLIDSRFSLDPPAGVLPAGTPTVERPAAAMVHFACHSNTEDAYPDNHQIDIDLAGGPAIWLVSLRARAAADDVLGRARPWSLVFINSCASGKPPQDSKASFPGYFISQNCKGVIGTLCDIPDVAAAHFATIFYQSLLRGRDVGEAMYDARWHLMDRHLNPFGLLYTYYGNPYLKLAHPHPGRIEPTCTEHVAG